MIKIILTVGLLLIFVYAVLQRKRIRLLTTVIALSVIPGLAVVWFPEAATVFANAIGVGRGADLIFYLWILISAGVMVIMHVQLKAQEQRITLLAREIAIGRAELPSGANDTASS